MASGTQGGPLDALLGRVFNGGVQLELGGGLDFKDGITAAWNPATKRVEVRADAGGPYIAVRPTNDGGVSDQSSVLQTALDAAEASATTKRVVLPAGKFRFAAVRLPSGVTLEGQGDATVLVECHLTATGSASAEIPFTAPAAKGARSISIPAAGLSGYWLRIASVINCQSTDAGADQLGDRAVDASFFAEFVRVKVGGVSSASLYKGLEFAYSNTPGADSGGFSTSVARVVSFHTSGRIRSLKLLGKNAAYTEAVLATFCRDFRLEGVTIDLNDSTAYAVAMYYCLDCVQSGGSVVGKLTNPSLSSQNVVLWGSCQGCYAEDVTAVGGYQTFDVTYPVQDATYRGGPSIDCGAINCTAEGYEVDGFTTHGGTVRGYFLECRALGGASGANGFRVRARGDRVLDCAAIGWGSAGAGVKVHEAALFDSTVSRNNCRGFANGVEFDCAATTFGALRALLGGSRAQIDHNTLCDLTSNGIALLASPALATMIGPHVHHNSIFNPGGDGIDVGAYVNGAVIEDNRITGVPSGARGIRFTTNIKRLYIGDHHIYGVDAAGFAVGGASVVNMITDAVTFPSGNAEAQLYIGRIDTDAATPFTGIYRDTSGVGYARQHVAGWQPNVGNVSPSEPTLATEALLAWYLSGTDVLGKSLDAAGTTTRRYVLTFYGSADPTAGGGVAAAQPALYLRSTTGVLYTKTGAGNTAWTVVGSQT